MSDHSETPCNCFPINSEIEQCINEFYTNLPKGEVARGLSVGAIEGANQDGYAIITRCFSGYANVEDKIPIAEDTVFEIGSISKTFTTTMLAAAVNAGLMDLSDPAQKYYGSIVTLPVYRSDSNEVQMSLEDLADFTSGLPDKSPKNTTGPNDYSFEDMYSYLESFKDGLPVEPGTKYKYVNTNFGIIANLLMIQGKYDSYGDMLTNMLTESSISLPNSGVITSNSPSIKHLAQGYQIDGTVAKNYALSTWPALLGAGGIYSTLEDMLEWLQFNMGLLDSSYNDLLPILQKVYFSINASTEAGLGWFISNLNGSKMISKNGGTSGFHSFIGFLPESTIGVVVLSNSAMSASAPINQGKGSPVDNLGKNILSTLSGTDLVGHDADFVDAG